MNNQSSQKSNQSQSITMKNQPILRQASDRKTKNLPEKERIGSGGNVKKLKGELLLKQKKVS